MPRTSEPTLNDNLARVLRRKHPRWGESIAAEQTGVLQDEAGKHPDIIVRHPGGQTIVIETEYEPASTVEQDARERLGKVLAETGQPIEQVVAVVVPAVLRQAAQEQLPELISATNFRYCEFSGETADTATRWPASGWLQGSLDDLAGLIEQTALSERRIKEGIRILEDGVAQAAGRLRAELQHDYPDVLAKMAQALHQEDGEQTSRMAMAIVANALTFHTAIADTHGIPPLDNLLSDIHSTPDKGRILDGWDRIMREVNYWPIFKIARDVLQPVPDRTARPVLDRLARVARELDGIGATTVHDLSGQMFGRLIADRKFLATFYTLPASAALLAELAISRFNVDWANPEAMKALQIADLACGTGALLSASYRAIAIRHRRAGGDDEAIHREMIEHSLIGADIMPAATHLTASMLSSAHPTVTFNLTRIHTMPYGDLTDESRGGVAIGSLDLTLSDEQPSLFGTGEHVLLGKGEAVEVSAAAARDAGDTLRLPHETADLVIMNPPFQRPTNPEVRSAAAPVPSFAGFSTSKEEQRAMSSLLRRIRVRLKLRAGHGNAGLGSNFIDLAHAKLRPGGVLALVLPATALSGAAWAQARSLLARAYHDITIVTIAAAGQGARSFSADTGMAEALIVATRRNNVLDPDDEDPTYGSTLFINLDERPQSIARATELARAANSAPDEPTGVLTMGTLPVGRYIRAAITSGGAGQLKEDSLAATASALARGLLKLPRMREEIPVPVVRLGELGQRGLVDRDIYGRKPDGSPRGPFDALQRRAETPTYPMLCNHQAARERQLVVLPDREGQVRPHCHEKALDVWESATRLHFTRLFQLNSQSLAACLTENIALGGQGWPNFRVGGDLRREEALTLWANTTLGLIAFWWQGDHTQHGRTRLRFPDCLRWSRLMYASSTGCNWLTPRQSSTNSASASSYRPTRPTATRRDRRSTVRCSSTCSPSQRTS